jgi:hypothetical protein
MRATSRGRLGSASSSRPGHHARLRPSSRHPVLRRLGVGGAGVWRTVWGWWQAAVMAEPRRGAQPLRPEALRCAPRLLWRMMEGAHRYRLLRHVPVYRDVYERARAFGIIFNY